MAAAAANVEVAVVVRRVGRAGLHTIAADGPPADHNQETTPMRFMVMMIPGDVKKIEAGAMPDLIVALRIARFYGIAVERLWGEVA